MPNGPLTFLDLKKMEGTPGYDLVEENVRLSPELTVFPADITALTAIELTVRTDLPNVQFSNIGEGVVESKSGFLTRLFELANLDALIKIPVNMLTGKPAALAAKLMTNEQAGFVEAAIRSIGKQVWYGVKNDSKGFIGVIAQMINDATHVIDAGGTDAGSKTSVFIVSVGRNKAEFWFGNNRTLAFDEWKTQTVNDAKGNPMEAEIAWMHCTPGFRLSNRNAVVRIKNLTNQEGNGLTGDLLNQAFRQMRDDLGMIPTAIFMAGTSQEQFRQTFKTALNPNPPLPTEFEGVPFHISHNVLIGETI